MEEEENPPPAMDVELPDMDELFGNDDDQDMEVQEDSMEMALDWLERGLFCVACTKSIFKHCPFKRAYAYLSV